MATATFPSSRPATDRPEGTGAQSPSQVRVGDRIRAVHPGFALLVEKLDRDKQPAARLIHQSHELHAAPIGARPPTDAVGRGERAGGGASADPSSRARFSAWGYCS